MRSKLFVPGVRPELFTKALAGAADAISIDMEDSVVESKKNEVRKIIAKFLQSSEVEQCSKPIIVRCNSLTSDHFEADIMAVIRPNLSMLNLPKIESASDVLVAVHQIEKAEKANKVINPVKLLVNIETPKGLRNVAEISNSHKRIAGLQLGLNDLFDASSIARSDVASIHTVMFMVRMAASEAGIDVYDGAYPDIENLQGLQIEAEMAQRLGYSGKSCIHPKQVSTINSLFAPGEDELAFAEQIVEAANKAEDNGVGVFTLSGKMIDFPTITRAKSLLAEFKRTKSGLTDSN
jgi:citrate lyase subunit beta/citryl-CoA lyase